MFWLCLFSGFVELRAGRFFSSSSSKARNNSNRNIQTKPSKNESRWLTIRARTKNIDRTNSNARATTNGLNFRGNAVKVRQKLPLNDKF
jgi:hypothetical protein